MWTPIRTRSGSGSSPRLRVEAALRLDRRRDRVVRGRERGMEPVARRLHDQAVALLDGIAEDLVVAGERVADRVGVLLPQPSGALEIGEQERHRASR